VKKKLEQNIQSIINNIINKYLNKIKQTIDFSYKIAILNKEIKLAF